MDLRIFQKCISSNLWLIFIKVCTNLGIMRMKYLKNVGTILFDEI